MCNLYNLTTNQHAILDLVSVARDRGGNLIPSLDVYPYRVSSVVWNRNGGRELATLTCDMPTLAKHLTSRDALATGDTNVRSAFAPHWRQLVSTTLELLRRQPVLHLVEVVVDDQETPIAIAATRVRRHFSAR